MDGIRRNGAAGAGIALGALFGAGTAEAATFEVTNLDDSGAGSLRDAIGLANADISADEILFQSGLSGTIDLSGGELGITDELTISGPGKSELTIDADGSSRIFNVDTDLPVTIEGIRMEAGSDFAGAGVFSVSGSDLTIRDSRISGGDADAGAAILADGGSLSVEGTTIANNYAYVGAGVYAVDMEEAAVRRSTIRNNRAEAFAGGLFGGVYDLTFANSTLSGNTTQSYGSAFGVFTYTMSMRNTSITDNVGRGLGGGLINGAYSATEIRDSTITGNTVRSGDSSFAVGGGAYLRSLGRTTVLRTTVADNAAIGAYSYGGGLGAIESVSISDSTISGNSAGLEGGGIVGVADLGAAPAVTNSTISGNRSGTSGGGLYLFGSSYGSVPQAAITSSTIASNRADSDDDGTGEGGGVASGSFDPVPPTLGPTASSPRRSFEEAAKRFDGNPEKGDFRGPEESPFSGGRDPQAIGDPPGVSILSTIVSQNTDAGGEAPDCAGITTSNGFNLLGTTAGCTITPAGSDQVGPDPLLEPLAGNGGTTETRALQVGSPAVDAGSPASPPLDQRGVSRDGAPDVGAFELHTCEGVAATIVGTPGQDIINGTPGDDVIVALGGDDKIKSLGGDDIVCAGGGDDRVDGGARSDTILGEGGADRVNGNGGGDEVNGNGGADKVLGESGRDLLRGGGGDDELFGGGGFDDLRALGGDDIARGGEGKDEIRGGKGTDEVRGEAGGDTLDGGPGSRDRVNGGNGKDFLAGGSGARDFCNGAAGRDRANATCNRQVNIP